MAVLAAVPCVLLPEWDRTRELWDAEETQGAVIERLECDLDYQNRVLEALRTDPAVNIRLAQRDLGYRPPGERVVVVENLEDHPPVTRCSTLTDRDESTWPIPGSLRRLGRKLPEIDHQAVFCRDPSRITILLMSGALIVVALALFPVRR